MARISFFFYQREKEEVKSMSKIRYSLTYEYVGLIGYDIEAESLAEAISIAEQRYEAEGVPVLDKFIEENPEHDIQPSGVTGGTFQRKIEGCITQKKWES